MRKTTIKKVTDIYCDACGGRDGEEDGEGHRVVRKMTYWAKHLGYKVKKLRTNPRCGHDICSDCFYFPGDLDHCPKCGNSPNKNGKFLNRGSIRKNPNSYFWCRKHNHGKQDGGWCTSCDPGKKGNYPHLIEHEEAE